MVLLYVVGGVSVAVGALSALGWLLALASSLDRLRRLARIRPLTMPVARRQARKKLAYSLGLALVGVLFLLTAPGLIPIWFAGAAVILLLIAEFGPILTPYRRRHPAS